MNTTESCDAQLRKYLSPRKLMLLGVNGVCFGALLALLAIKGANGRIVMLSFSTGLMFSAQLVGAVLASRRTKVAPPP